MPLAGLSKPKAFEPSGIFEPTSSPFSIIIREGDMIGQATLKGLSKNRIELVYKFYFLIISFNEELRSLSMSLRY